MIKLIVGLGNPGTDYEATRHNVGAWWLNALCERNQIQLKKEKKFHGNIGLGQIQGHAVRCLLPTTFMNLSGNSVQSAAKYFNVKPEEILIAHDELDIKPGTMRLKQGGGHGGHNGLRDIIPKLHSPNFYRLRIGIGHPGDKNKVANYVLNRPNAGDHKVIWDVIEESLNQFTLVLEGKTQIYMNNLHSFESTLNNH